MRLTHGYQINPGCCFSCRSSKTEPVIDMERDDPAVVRRSHVYICQSCIVAAFDLLDITKVFVPKDTLIEKDRQIGALTDECARLTQEADIINARLRAPAPTPV